MNYRSFFTEFHMFFFHIKMFQWFGYVWILCEILDKMWLWFDFERWKSVPFTISLHFGNGSPWRCPFSFRNSLLSSFHILLVGSRIFLLRLIWHMWKTTGLIMHPFSISSHLNMLHISTTLTVFFCYLSALPPFSVAVYLSFILLGPWWMLHHIKNANEMLFVV